MHRKLVAKKTILSKVRLVYGLEVALQNVHTAGQTGKVSQIRPTLSKVLNLLDLFNALFIVPFKLIDLSFAKRTRVLNLSGPLLYALETIQMCTTVEPGILLRLDDL